MGHFGRHIRRMREVYAERLGCLVDAATRQQVEVTPLSRYAHAAMPRDGLQLGFAAVGTQEIRRGVEVLAGILT